jgi:acetyl esterase/lipase
MRVVLTVVFLILAITGHAARVDPVGDQTSTPDYSRQPEVIYRRTSGVALTMEIFTPAKPNGHGAIWVVSSNGVSSREQTLTPSFERRVAPLLKRGYTVFAVIHRSSPDFQVPDYIADARYAVRYVRHNAVKYAIDRDRIGIAGSSSGGSIALTVAFSGDNGDPIKRDTVEDEPSRVQAAAAFFAPTDFLNVTDTKQNIIDLMQQQAGKVDPAFLFHDVNPATGERKLITSRGLVLNVLRAISPATHVGPGDPPTLLIHGDADKAVPVRQSRLLMDKLNAERVTARLIVREGMGHAYQGWEADAESVADWFDQHLRGNARAKPPGAGGF